MTISQYHSGRPKSAKTKIATTITYRRKAVPQRGWISAVSLDGLGLELVARLVCVDRLVLGSVILEHAPE